METSSGGTEGGNGDEEGGRGGGLGVFEYIDRLHQRSPIFYNLLYAPDLDNPVGLLI